MDHCKLLAFSILFLSLRALGVQGTCEQISVVKNWRGGYSVHFNIPIADNLSSWTTDITFSPPVKYVKSWGAKSFTSDGKVLHLSSYPHTTPLAAGSVLKFGFNVSHSPADPAPDMVAVVFNDQYICKGEIEPVDRTKTTASPTTTVPLTTEEPPVGTESATEELPASTDEPATEEPSITADMPSARKAKRLLAEEPLAEEISTSTTTTTTTTTPTTTTKRTTSTNTTTKPVRNSPTTTKSTRKSPTTKATRKPPTTKAARRPPTTKASRKSPTTKSTRKSPTTKATRRPSNPRAARKFPAKRKSPATRKPTPSTTKRPTTKPTTKAADKPIIPTECHSVAELLQSDPYRFMILFHIPFANYTKDWLFQVDFSGDYHCLSTIPYANIGHSNFTLHSSSVQSAGSVYDGLLVEVLYGRTRPLMVTSMLLNGKSICGAGVTAKTTRSTPAYPFRLSLKQDWQNTRCPGQV